MNRTIPKGLVLAVVALGACGSSAPTSVLLHVELTPGLQAPDELRLTVFGSLGRVVDGQRIPTCDGCSSQLPGDLVLYPSQPAGALRLLLRARLAGKLLGEAAMQVELVATEQVRATMTITPGTLADRDGDEVPDLIDRCPDTPDPAQSAPCPPLDGGVEASIDAVVSDAADGPTVDQAADLDAASDLRPPDVKPAPDVKQPDIKTPDIKTPDIKAPTDLKAPPPCTEANSGLFGGHCYFVVATATDWTSAESSCAALSVAGHPVHLVTVTSAAEHTFVVSLPGTDGHGRWIGLQSAAPSASKSAFSWVSGEAATLDRWMLGTPHSAGACVVLHSPSYSPPNVWEDMSCSTKYRYVCERE